MTKAFVLPTMAQAAYNFGKAEGEVLAVIALLQSGEDDAARRMFICGYTMSKIRGQEATQTNWDKVNTDYDLTGNDQKAAGVYDGLRAAARAWSRLLKKHGATSKHGNAGNANAKGKAKAAPAPVAPAKLPAIKPDKLTRAAFLALALDTLATLATTGKACEDVEAAAIKEIETLRAKIAARAKIEK